jgi:hypothetical protein
MSSSPYSTIEFNDFSAGAGAEHLDYDFLRRIDQYYPNTCYYQYSTLPNLHHFIEYHPTASIPQWHWEMDHDHQALHLSNWSDVALTDSPRTPTDYPVPHEYHDCDFGIDEKQHHQLLISNLGSPQLGAGETVVTSIELPPIQHLIEFPWTPVGVELPPLRGFWSEVKQEDLE